jgi:hypothetical protein
MTQWGKTAGVVYTGGSDGFVKQWDITGATRDAFVQDIFQVPNEIMCGRLSPDKSSMLISDSAGVIYVLDSSGRSVEKLDDYPAA